MEFNTLPVIAILVVFFLGLGGLTECRFEHEQKIKCIEKTGDQYCKPDAPEKCEDETVESEAVS